MTEEFSPQRPAALPEASAVPLPRRWGCADGRRRPERAAGWRADLGGRRRAEPLVAPAPLLLLYGGVVAVLALSGPGSKDMHVTFSLYDFAGTSTCAGRTGGYSDVGAGSTAAVVKNNDGKVVGTARFGDGPSSKLPPATWGDFTPGGCIWSTTVKGVPAGEDFYTVTVGNRGMQTYSKVDLDKNK